MPRQRPVDEWSGADAYEAYVGRWSRPVARHFLVWLGAGTRQRWLDVGCGTGALTATIAAVTDPREVVGIDPSGAYLEQARRLVDDRRVRFLEAGASAPPSGQPFDAAVSGLVLNFLGDLPSALEAIRQVVEPQGIMAAYVWDYSDRMEMMRYLWDAAAALDNSARELDEGVRFPLCDPDRLAEVWRAAGFHGVETTPIEVATRFRNFDDYWLPFLGGQGPAPGYVMSLTEERRVVLREAVRSLLPIAPDGSVSLVARAWAVKGRTPPI
ncbi:MAG: methyltransferase domain-containing protein [Nitriliruptorales bacterium]|nr:methyltransferase domain-containing protein [Nitriliruptorales bacterium]